MTSKTPLAIVCTKVWLRAEAQQRERVSGWPGLCSLKERSGREAENATARPVQPAGVGAPFLLSCPLPPNPAQGHWRRALTSA